MVLSIICWAANTRQLKFTGDVFLLKSGARLLDIPFKIHCRLATFLHLYSWLKPLSSLILWPAQHPICIIFPFLIKKKITRWYHSPHCYGHLENNLDFNLFVFVYPSDLMSFHFPSSMLHSTLALLLLPQKG